MKLAFLGLGTMGGPMADWLFKAGHPLKVYNRGVARREKWDGAHENCLCAPDIATAVADADIVFACVGNDQDAQHVGLAAISHMKSGSLYVDHTTTSASIAILLSDAAAAKNIGFLDAPVSGGEAGAVNGRLTAMIGGDGADLAKATPFLSAYCANIRQIGPVGHGQLAKMVNQIAIAGVVQGLAEAVHFATSAGINTDAVLEAISKGAAGSWQMENRWKTMVKGEFNFGFAVDWMRKDLDIVLKQAEKIGITLPVTAQIDDFYADVQGMGGNRWDTSSLVARLKPSATEE